MDFQGLQSMEKNRISVPSSLRYLTSGEKSGTEFLNGKMYWGLENVWPDGC